MTEIALSTNLAQIELEISHHKQIAGQSIWEIGRRLNHVKENDLVHGQFSNWVESIGMDRREAHKFMKVAQEIPNDSTFSHLGTSALYLIATLPEEEKQIQIERIEEGDSPTVRELQEVKKRLNEKTKELVEVRAEVLAKDFTIRELENKAPEVIEKEVIPSDYDTTKSLNKTLMDRNKALAQEKEELEEELAQLKKTSQTSQEVENLLSRKNEIEKEISDYKAIKRFVEKGDELLTSLSGMLYQDESRFRNADHVIGLEIDSLVFRLRKFTDDLQATRQKNNFIEGVIVNE